MNPLARETVLVSHIDEPFYLLECQKDVDPNGDGYSPIEFKLNKRTTISASRLLNHQASSGAPRTLKIKRSNQNAFEKDCLSGQDILQFPTIYFYKDPGEEDIKIYRQKGSGGLLAEAGRIRAVRWFWKPPVLTEVPRNDQNAPSDQSEL